MLATRLPMPPTDERRLDRDGVRRLVVTEYSRQLVAGAIHESLVEALHVRGGELGPAELTWLREWLSLAVPRLTERTIIAVAAQLEAGLSSAPDDFVGRLDERRRRANLGVE